MSTYTDLRDEAAFCRNMEKRVVAVIDSVKRHNKFWVGAVDVRRDQKPFFTDKVLVEAVLKVLEDGLENYRNKATTIESNLKKANEFLRTLNENESADN